MASSLSACVRITTRHNAVWRDCAACGALSPLSPDQTRCTGCRSSRHTHRRG